MLISAPRHACLIIHHRLRQRKHLSELGCRSAKAVQWYDRNLVPRSIQTWVAHASRSLWFIQLMLLFVVLWKSRVVCKLCHASHRLSTAFPWWCTISCSLINSLLITLHNISCGSLFGFWTVDFGRKLLVLFQSEVCWDLSMALNSPMVSSNSWFRSRIWNSMRRCYFLFALFLKLKYKLFGLIYLASSSACWRYMIEVFLTTARFECLLIIIFYCWTKIFDLSANHMRSLHFYQTLTLALFDLILIELRYMDFVLDLMCWYNVWVDYSTRIFLWRVSNISTLLWPRWHLLIMWEFTHHSCTTDLNCWWNCRVLEAGVWVILKSRAWFSSLWRREVASLVLGQSLTWMKLFKCDFVF